MRTISILGCGWLGLPIGGFLLDNGYKVKGSTATADKLSDLKENGIEPYYIKLSPEINAEYSRDFFKSDILIINFPPQRRNDIIHYHKLQIESLIHELKHSSIQNAIFVSSTSVYPEVNREVTEEDNLEPSKDSGKALQAVENMLKDCSKFKTTIVRLAGLIGYDRMPGKFLSGKRNLINGESPVNLIHRDDCIQIIFQIIEQNFWGEILNACADKHPNRKDYYTEQARLIGFDPPIFDESEHMSYKIISNKKLKTSLNYTFKYPDPSLIIENIDSRK